MKYNRVLSLILAFAILLGCTGLVPAYAATSGNDPDSSLSSQDSAAEQIQAPQYVDAEQFAQADHTERLYDEEQMNTYVYRNQDGSKSVYYMGQNVKYQHKDGTIRDKDTTLVRADRGYRMRDNDVDLHLPDSPADGITLAHGSSSVKLLPQGGSGSARLTDNSILYAGYFGGKTILRYTPMLSGVKEDIILVSYTGQNSFAFVLETGGLYLYEAKGQYYLAESAEAEATFYLGQVVVYDAMGRPGNGNMTVETLISGQQYRLTLSADVDFLTDPETVYPVTIDPTLTVSYSVQGVNAIEDAPIYEGKPNSNYSNYVYNRVGYYDDEYKTARTVMRPAALLSSTEWQSIGSGDITSLTLYIKESSSKSAKQVNVHALTENNTWTETNVKWSNVGAYSSTVYASASLGSGDWAEFNLTTLAKAWKNGTQNENCGILLKLADESVYRTFYAGEYSTIDYRPYMVLEYKQDLILNLTKKDINEGGSFTLTATTQLGVPEDLSWSSNATTVASVSPSGNSGVVTALKAGQAIITATATDADGETISATCIVYVKIPDGTYYISNAGSGLCMANHDSTVDDDSVFITNKNTTTVTQPTQFWEITYTHDGWYVIRPVDRPLAVLTANSSGGVIVQDFAQNATIQIKDSWTISWSSLGYVFKHKGLNALTAPTPNNPESMLQTATPILSVKCHWELSDAVGIVLRDSTTLRSIPASTEIYIEKGDTLTIADLGISYSHCGVLRCVSWSPIDESICTTVISSGTVTGINLGQTAITLSANIAGVQYSQSYTLICVKTINIEVIYDHAYTTRHSDAVDRINRHLTDLSDFYLTNFYVRINHSEPEKFLSYADAECSSTPDDICEECKNARCFYSQVLIDGTLQLSEYHHKSITNIAMRIPFPDTSQTFKIAFIGHTVCDYSNGVGCTYEANGTQTTFGITYKELGLALVVDHRSEDSELLTLIHEFGHLFGALDHYGGTYSPSTDEMLEQDPSKPFARNCLYGEYGINWCCLNDVVICEACANMIYEGTHNITHA